ncbi:MAG: hypothetical protein ACR2PS_19905 [Pseudomonadales bacterium]
MPYLNREQPMVYNLQSKDVFFDELLFANEIMQQILKFFLNDPWYTAIPRDAPNYIPQAIYDGLTDSQKAVLGFYSVPYNDETRGIDMKRNYELLPTRVEGY